MGREERQWEWWIESHYSWQPMVIKKGHIKMRKRQENQN